MSQAAKAQEPSMEEILASIRRIIADDEAKPAANPADAPAYAAQTPTAEPAAMSQDDIDTMLAGFDAPAEARDESAPAEESAEVLELTAAMETMAEPAPAFRTIDSDPDVVFGEPDYEPEASRYEPEAPPEPPPARYRQEPKSSMFGDHFERQLLSDHTDATVSSAFGSLAHTVLAQNARTIDDLVRDMLRPMLKSWLDENLPTIVERLVRAEIERVSRGRG